MLVMVLQDQKRDCATKFVPSTTKDRWTLYERSGNAAAAPFACISFFRLADLSKFNAVHNVHAEVLEIFAVSLPYLQHTEIHIIDA